MEAERATKSGEERGEETRGEGLEPIILRLADRVGELIDFWGFSPHTGRIWTLLYLTDEPLSAAAIGERLQISTGLVSQTLNELVRWGVVHRTRQPQSKAWLYAEDPDIWKSVTRVLRERERHRIEETVGLLDSLLAAAEEEAATDPQGRTSYIVVRLQALRDLARAALLFLDAILAAARLDVGPFMKVMRLSEVRRKLPFMK